MGISIFPQPSAGGNSNLTTSDLTTYSASLPQLTKRATYTSSQNTVSVPAGTNFVYALVIGGGGGGQGVGSGSQANYYSSGGQGGGVSFGLTKPTAKAIVGAGGNAGSSGGNSEFDKGGGSGGASYYGGIYAPGGAGGYSYYNGSLSGQMAIGYSSLLGRLGVPGSLVSQPNYLSGTSQLYDYSDASYFDVYSFTANGATGQRPDTSVRNNNNYAAGLPTNLNPYNGGARGGGASQGGNVYGPFRGGGGAGYLGNGGAASANSGGNGGSGGGGGGGAGPLNNWDSTNSSWINSTTATGGAGGAGVVELYY